MPLLGWYRSLANEFRLSVGFLGWAALAVLNPHGIRAQPPTQPSARQLLDQRVPLWLKTHNVTGMGVAWIAEERVSWVDYYGVQYPGGPAVSDQTLYDVASLTKTISAEVILRLASEGRLSLDEPIYPHWTDPDLRNDKWNRLLTPRLCLSHQTGFPNWRYLTGNVLRFQWEPGTAFGYSGEGYNYVARFAQKKTGMPWEDLAQRYVFDPVGMPNTSFTPRSWWNGRQAKPVETGSRTNWSAAALLRTTVGDYARFVVNVMHDKGLDKKVSADRFRITRDLTTPELNLALRGIAKDPSNLKVATGYGLGWHIVDINGRVLIDHTGADSDVMTFAFFVPSQHIGAVIFTDGPNVGHEMIDDVMGVLYDDPLFLKTLWIN